MITSWEHTLRTDSLRIIQSCHQISTGFYRLNNFIVLPSDLKQDNQTIAVPDLDFLSIPRFWERVRKINTHSCLHFSISSEFLQAVESIVPATEPDFILLKRIWSKHESSILKLIQDLIPQKKSWIKHIVIYPTSFGSITTFAHLNNPGTVRMWLRQDASISNIVEALVTSLTREDAYHHLGFTWNESEAVTDWILAYSPLSAVLQKIDPHFTHSFTLKTTRNRERAILNEISQKFIQKIGAPCTNISAIKNLKLTNFSIREKKLLELLLSRSPHLVSIDEISELLFSGNENKFSLYVISKSIQRLRDKLENHGISGSFIQTRRGRGYLIIS
jgi:hypothetical protein